MAEYIESLKQRLIEINHPTEKIIGCTTQQINKMCSQQGVNNIHFPKLYHEFLETFGGGAGGLFRGSEYSFKSHMYSNLKEEFIALLKSDESDFIVTDNMFVILGHLLYVFAFIDVGECTDNPTVYLYVEGDDAPRSHGNFQSLLEAELRLVTRVNTYSCVHDSNNNDVK